MYTLLLFCKKLTLFVLFKILLCFFHEIFCCEAVLIFSEVHHIIIQFREVGIGKIAFCKKLAELSVEKAYNAQMLVQRGCADLTQSNGIPLSFQDVLHFIVRSVLIIKSQIAGEILRDYPVLNVLTDHLTVYGFSKDLINLDQTGKILPASGCGKDLSVYGILHPVEIFSAKLQIGDHRRMNSLLIGVFLPYIKVCLHIDLLDAVQSNHIKFPDGFVIFWRVACCDDYPAFRHLLVSEGFSLKELQHHRR